MHFENTYHEISAGLSAFGSEPEREENGYPQRDLSVKDVFNALLEFTSVSP